VGTRDLHEWRVAAGQNGARHRFGGTTPRREREAVGMTEESTLFWNNVDLLAIQCESIVAAWGQVASQGAVGAADGSPAAADRTFASKFIPTDDAEIEHLVMAWPGLAARYVDTMALYISGISALLGKHQVAITLWPLIRAEVETAGRVWWFLDPGTEEKPVVGMSRLARFMMEWVLSACFEKRTASIRGLAVQEREWRAERERRKALTRHIFRRAVSSLDWGEPGDEGNWSIGSERYAGLGAAVRRFADDVGARGLYDVLSAYSHPSIDPMLRQTDMRPRPEGFHQLVYPLRWDVIEWQCKVACLALYRTAHLVVAYNGFDGACLEAWADAATSEFRDWVTDSPDAPQVTSAEGAGEATAAEDTTDDA
jgi:hypothetical protein